MTSCSQGPHPTLRTEITLGQGSTIRNTITDGRIKDSVDIEIDLHCVADGLWLGGYQSALDPMVLKERGITHVVNCIADDFQAYHDGITYLNIYGLYDHGRVPIRDLFDEVTDFIHGAIHARGQVLVHCQAGRSRSATLAAAYLIRYKHMTDEEAIRCLTLKRDCVDPNLGFVFALNAYYTSLQQQQTQTASAE